MPRAVTLTWKGKERPEPGDATPPRARVGHARDGAGCLLEGDNLRVLRGLAATRRGRRRARRTSTRRSSRTASTRRCCARPARHARAARACHAFDDRWRGPARLPATRWARASRRCGTCSPRTARSSFTSIRRRATTCASSATRSSARRPSRARSSGATGAGRARRRTSSACTTCCCAGARTRSVPPRWNQPYEPLAASTLATWGTRKQRAVFKDGRRARSSSTEETRRACPWGTSGRSASSRRSRASARLPVAEARGAARARRWARCRTRATWCSIRTPGAGPRSRWPAARVAAFIGIDAGSVAIATTLERLGVLGPMLETSPVERDADVRVRLGAR